MALADVPLRAFLSEAVVPYEDDEVTRLIIDTTRPAFAPISHLTVGDFRDWLLAGTTEPHVLAPSRRASRRRWSPRCRKLMRNQDLILGGEEAAGRHALSQHDRAAGTPVGAPAAEPSDRRSERHRRHRSSTACCTAAAMR